MSIDWTTSHPRMSDSEETNEVGRVKTPESDSLGSDTEFACCAGVLCKSGNTGGGGNIKGDAAGAATNIDITAVAAEVLRHLQLGAGLQNGALDLGIRGERRQEPIRPVHARAEESTSSAGRGGEGPPLYREYYGRPRYDYYRDLGPTPGYRRTRFMERDRTDKGRSYHEYEIRKREPSDTAYARRDIQQLPASKRGGYKR